METERIDGIEYVVGTAEWAAAKRAQQQRLDAAFLEAHHATREHYQRRLTDQLGDRFDANQVAFLARDLVFMRRVIEQTIYDRLRAAEFVPVSTEIPRGAQTYATRRMDERGEAKVSVDLAGDAPRADVALEEDQAKLVNVRASYAYSVQDLEFAAFAGIPLPRDKAVAAANMIARGLDRVGRYGDDEVGVTGFFNNPLIPKKTLTNGEWLTATVAELIADLQDIEQTAITQSRDNHMLETLLLPTAYEGRLATLRIDSNSDLTVKEWFLKNARMIKRIERWFALDEATGTQVTVTDPPLGILYERSPEILFWPIPIIAEEPVPPQLVGLEWIHQMRARCGGVDVRRPKGALYLENLD